jgi:excisionase family DNA binding protein
VIPVPSTVPVPDSEAPALLDVEAVAALLSISTKSVRRLADAGKMPRPVKLGALIRWRRSELDAWIADGCRKVLQKSC